VPVHGCTTEGMATLLAQLDLTPERPNARYSLARDDCGLPR